MDSLEADKLKAQNAELAQKWLSEITRMRGKEKLWREKGQKVIDRYRDDRIVDGVELAKFNILWSNTETIKPAIFSRMPVPDVRRRWSTKDPASRTAALILERSLTFINSTFNFRDVLDRVNEDYVLPGRAIAQVCYDPLTLTKPMRQPVSPLPPNTPHEQLEKAVYFESQSYPEGTLTDTQGAYQMQDTEYKAWESIYVDYVPWQLFGFSECSQWSKVPAVWIGDYLRKDEIQLLVPSFDDWNGLNFKEGTDSQPTDSRTDELKQPPQTVLIWKVWHKSARKYMVFADGYLIAPLLIVDDPQQLQGFYPLPEPLYSLRNNGSWLPKPEYLLYQDQANELDIVVGRMRALVSACKNVGVYDQAMDELAKISELPTKGDNQYIPIPNFRDLAEKGGLESLLSSLPIEQIVKVIAELREREAELKQQIYEVYGISDIMRGASEASETLGAQQLKAQYGALRISTRQGRFQDFIRDIFRIQAELIAEHFDADTLRIMTGMQVIPDAQFEQLKQQKQLESGMVSESEFNQAIQIIKSDKMRGFNVDIEADSTVPVNLQAEQQGRIAFITAIGTYLQGVIPAVQSGAIPVAVAREAMLFVVRGFKVGSELEEVLEQIGDDSNSGPQLAQLQQMAEQLKQQVQELTQENQQLQNEKLTQSARAQADIAVSQATAHNDIVVDTVKTQNKILSMNAKGNTTLGNSM